MIEKILAVFVVPIIILNAVGGIVGGIWLAFLGEWRLIVLGLALVFTAHWYLSILMLPGLGLGYIAISLWERGNPFKYIFGFLTQFYTNLLIIGTCAFAFFTCTRFYEGTSKFALIPYLLWSWGMALGPWQFFQSKEPENDFSALTLFVATSFYFVFLISGFLTPIVMLAVAGLFVLVQLLVLPIFSLYAANAMNYDNI